MRCCTPRPIAVIGAGFSGSLLSIHLAQAGRDVLLIERKGEPGRGIAYGTEDPLHLLNVPAQGMSAFPDQPGHFLEWLTREGHKGLPAAFAPRKLYGRYIRENLDAAPARIMRIAGEARDVVPLDDGGYEIHLAEGAIPLKVSAVALCLGNPPASRQHSPPHLFGDPWDPRALDGLSPDDDLLLVGTGLTMADLAITLLQGRGHRGVVHAISRRGWLPLPHAAPSPAPEPAPKLMEGAGPRAIARMMRRAAEEAMARGIPWQAALDGFRPQLQGAWRSMPARERARFLRHGRTPWNLHRHRIAPEAGRVLAEAAAAGRLRVRAGRLQDWQPVPRGAEAVISTPCEGGERLEVARIIFCTGVDMGPDWLATELLGGLRDRGLLRGDDLGLGLDVDPDSLQALGADGRAVPNLYVVGPATRSALWEATAVPELRVQAQRVAAELTKG
jgi:uncharacterized NAD(P)/FAD-binding protein YdhS